MISTFHIKKMMFCYHAGFAATRRCLRKTNDYSVECENTELDKLQCIWRYTVI